MGAKVPLPPSSVGVSQYSNTHDKLAARVAILSYDSNDQSWYSWLESRLEPVGDVLEVGGGTGELWRNIDPSKAKLTLTDFSAAMCDQLRSLKIPGSTIEQCDAASLPFPDASFDLVIANHMLYHLDNPDAALKEFARVLRPGGRLRTALNGREHIKELLALGEAIGRPSQILDSARITAETGPEYLSKHFVDVSAEKFPGEFDVPSPEPVLAYLGSWGDDPMTLDQEKYARGEIQKRIDAEGSFKIKKDMILLSARRA
ncbi:methyltransferase type 11 [Aulographum hederae CBS 113979]|uniref:Methyltransferase type 11 n=1 Tax=Aulographum hederae CBS 113979 TaxID=1176131 RepID=A0A6G1GTZ5_9PEZI|nr:methyltransferase type 11 [Aulographum hederae CBS 113979]